MLLIGKQLRHPQLVESMQCNALIGRFGRTDALHSWQVKRCWSVHAVDVMQPNSQWSSTAYLQGGNKRAESKALHFSLWCDLSCPTFAECRPLLHNQSVSITCMLWSWSTLELWNDMFGIRRVLSSGETFKESWLYDATDCLKGIMDYGLYALALCVMYNSSRSLLRATHLSMCGNLVTLTEKNEGNYCAHKSR